MTAPKIAFLAPIPEYEEDWSHIETDYLRLFGDDTAFIDWTKADNLAEFDLVTPLLAWGYQRDYVRWFALLDRLEAEAIKLSNPVKILRWNSDKAYLLDLHHFAVPIVPTRLADALSDVDLAEAREEFGGEKLVIKPPISGGADGTYLITISDPLPPEVVGTRMLLQPYLPAIAEEGEYSLFYFAGNYSHTIIKRPASGDFRVQEQFGGREEAVEADSAMKALAERARIAASLVTGTGTLAYARVDMLRDSEGDFRLMELELIEPSLFLHFASDNGAAFASAILRQIG